MLHTPIRPRRRQLLTNYYYSRYYTTSHRRSTTTNISTVIPVELPATSTKVRTTKSFIATPILFLLLYVWYMRTHLFHHSAMIPSILQSTTNCNSKRTTRKIASAILPTVAAFPSSVAYSQNHRRRQLSSFMVVIRNRFYTTTTTTTTIKSTKTHLSSSTSTTTSATVGTRIPADTTPMVLQHMEFTSTTKTQLLVHPDEQPQSPLPVVIFLHGLLGNKRNFASIGRSIAAASSSSSSNTRPSRIIYSLDLRNHGDTYWWHRNQNHDQIDTVSSSSWIDMSYRTMAYDVIHFCNVHNITQIDTLIGHSIGGKVAQAVALLEPSRVKGLIVLDIAPVRYTSKEPHWLAVEDIIRTLLNVNMSSNRNDVEQQLRASIPDPNLRAFCLTNVDWSTGQWKIPLDHINNQLDKLAAFDLTAATSTTEGIQPPPQQQKFLYTGDAFFINGGQSKFVRSSHLSSIQEYFPNHMLTTIKGAGHWVHAEAPEDTTALIQQFLNR